MGNIETTLKKSDLILEKLDCEVHEDWNVSAGKLNGSPVTVFSAIHPPSSRKRPYMEKALQASKIYRHPGILRFMDGGIIEKEVVVVTEAAVPLLLHELEQMSALQITAGLASIIDALVFLHDKAGVSHNNVCASSIYVTSDGIWKLWGLEFLCSFGDLTRDHIEKINQYCSERNLPPDDKSHISPAYQHSRDSFCFAKFFQETISPLLTLDIPFFEDFMLFIKSKAMSSDWNERPRLATFLMQPVFNHEFLQLRQNINNILLMPSTIRDEFIKELPEILQRYPDDVVAMTYGSLLFSYTFLLIPASAKCLMPSLLTPKSCANGSNGLFTSDVFKESIIPHILNLFHIRDATVRKILLEHFHHYAALMSKETLAKDLLPQLLLGIRDTDEDLVAATLNCLAHLVTIVGADIVVGKHREHLFTTSKPKNDLNDNGKTTNRQKKQILDIVVDKEVIVQTAVETLCTEFSAIPIIPTADTCPLPDIPERSSPDGGEVSDEDICLGNKFDTVEESKNYLGDDIWSDWEEMLEQPPPEIVGIHKVETSEGGSLNLDFCDKNKIFSNLENIQKLSRNNSMPDLSQNRRKSTSSTISNTSGKESKGFAMQLKTSKENKTVSQGLGEEYDIMSIKVEKKPDSELDFFADLMPKLATKNYDLETMLIEASHKSKGRNKLPSLSDTLAELHSQGEEEGDGWNDGVWDDTSALDDLIMSDPSKQLKNISFKDIPSTNSSGISSLPMKASAMTSKSNDHDWNNSF